MQDCGLGKSAAFGIGLTTLGFGGFGAFINYRANRGVGWGFATGIAGGFALSYTYYYNRDALSGVLRESLLSGVFSSAAKLTHDIVTGNPVNWWAVGSYGFEGVSWGAWYQAFIHPLSARDPASSPLGGLDRILDANLLAQLQGLVQLFGITTATVSDLAGGLAHVNQLPNGSEGQLAAYGRMRDSIGEFVGGHIRDLG